MWGWGSWARHRSRSGRRGPAGDQLPGETDHRAGVPAVLLLLLVLLLFLLLFPGSEFLQIDALVKQVHPLRGQPGSALQDRLPGGLGVDQQPTGQAGEIPAVVGLVLEGEIAFTAGQDGADTRQTAGHGGGLQVLGQVGHHGGHAG
ncbi:hypothetical protein CSA17_01590, partial [bacterium DOLJORAL78_65_58]